MNKAILDKAEEFEEIHERNRRLNKILDNMKADVRNYLIPDKTECNQEWLVSRLIWWLDDTEKSAAQNDPEKSCKWTQDEDGNWFTDCDNAFTFIDGGPSENSMKYCCYCGKPLELVEYKEPEVGE